ncbi:nucleotidyltransferase domain-containing protein [Rudanella paleaurantiibacter]|uniref:Nucleotidyltransferase domain-containing protein n=1 Tax=Rudanella paleaurantiibacter TaxID=2614655 RepID=A0A7J5TYT2_9BACT|nr:aminoglycoside 6-adenylyltransferase [Rudanella paleaurantiibacter]KAB7730283.1 nucleotidyltransferase domain-containing protein [Rudanella paleaurantiibacter]
MAHQLPAFQPFVDSVISALQTDPNALGLAVGGSWISGDMDAYSDLDLVLVTAVPVAPDLGQMRAYAARFGTMLASFRGDHVGEPRLLIALFTDPLLHVDVKFVLPAELHERVEDPVILWERDGILTSAFKESVAQYPPFDFQATDDRFWIWMHYAALKIGRGEFFEAMDFLSFVRNMVLGPMLHLKQGGLPRGVRRVETSLPAEQLAALRQTVAIPERTSLLTSTQAVIDLYETLRDTLAPTGLVRSPAAERAVKNYIAALC